MTTPELINEITRLEQLLDGIDSATESHERDVRRLKNMEWKVIEELDVLKKELAKRSLADV